MHLVGVTRVSSRGQVVVPKVARDRLGLRTGDVLAVHLDGDRLVFSRAAAEGHAPRPKRGLGKRWPGSETTR